MFIGGVLSARSSEASLCCLSAVYSAVCEMYNEVDRVGMTEERIVDSLRSNWTSSSETVSGTHMPAFPFPLTGAARPRH